MTENYYARLHESFSQKNIFNKIRFRFQVGLGNLTLIVNISY